MTNQSIKAASNVPLRAPEEIDLAKFNTLQGPDYKYWNQVGKPGKPVEDIKQLFHKQIILDDETSINIETITVPGFIGISNYPQVKDPEGNTVSGDEDIVQFLNRDGLLICTYQYNKENYGNPIDIREPWIKDSDDSSENNEDKLNWHMETFIKNDGHHAGAIIPAKRLNKNGQIINSYATFNEPADYHMGMYGSEDNNIQFNDGFVAVAQRLVFPEFVSEEQARSYTDSIICWMGLISSFATFPDNTYNGNDATYIKDRETLKEFLQNCLLASLGFNDAIEFLNQPKNQIYCAEFIYISLNTLLYPFNKQTLTLLLDGNEQQANQILELRDRQNNRRPNLLSVVNRNPEFHKFNIAMPIVPEDLPPLDYLMQHHGQTPGDSLPFPPLKISQVIRRAFRTLLPRHKINNEKLVQAQAQLFTIMELGLIKQLHLDVLPQENSNLIAVQEFMSFVKETLKQQFNSYEEFEGVIDGIMEQADEFLKAAKAVGAEDLVYFVPPRIYVDLGQNDGDKFLPQGWGFRLETVGALIGREAIKSTVENISK